MGEIDKNFPWCDEYTETSFLAVLHQQRKWSDEKYFELENELYNIAQTLSNSEKINRVIAWRTMRIFSHTMLLFSCHFDPNDGFKIIGVDRDRLYLRRERFQAIFEGFFQGKMPSKDIFDYTETK